MQKRGSLKDAQGILRHSSIKTTGDIYVHTIERSVVDAVNSRTAAVLEGWETSIAKMSVKRAQLAGCSTDLAKFRETGKEGALST